MDFFRNRFNIINIVCIIIAGILLSGVFNLQLLQGMYYRELANKRLYKSMPIKAPRGDITDRYGRSLVTSKMAFCVQINDEHLPDRDFNKMLNSLIDLTRLYDKQYQDNLPLTANHPFVFRFNDSIPGVNNEGKWKTEMNLPLNATPDEVLLMLRDKYSIDSSLPINDIRALVGIRYDMAQRLFNTRNPFLFIKDANIDLVTRLKENRRDFPGVIIYTEPVREYPNGNLGAHFLGYVDIIYKDEYDKLKDKGYGMNDSLGKAGIEQKLEESLRGQDGRSSIEFASQDAQLKIIDSIPPRQGKEVSLTVDANVQKAAEQGLESAVKSLKGIGINDVGGGSVVAVQVNTGDVLAMATYPTYDIEKFKQKYSQLLKDELKPMLNRAISGTYAPGSTFKLLTSVAGLEEGVITPSEYIDCVGRYNYYAPSYTPMCLVYREFGQVHGPVNTVKALEVSCNYYFFEVGRRLTIEKLNVYGKKFGFGLPTGIDIDGEPITERNTVGIFAGPEFSKLMGSTWYPGNTLQAAIGQSDHMFTPLQIADYVNTIASDGKRYQPHIIKQIQNIETGEITGKTQPKVVETVSMKPSTKKTVYDGMRAVANSGTAVKVFKDAGYITCAKTGTAEVPSGTSNSLFVAFAPYDNPQIAVACVIEHGGATGQGMYIASIARKVIDAYLFSAPSERDTVANNTLLR